VLLVAARKTPRQAGESGHKHRPCDCYRRATDKQSAERAAVRDEYLEYRYGPAWGYSLKDAAQLIGICERTAQRYERWNREKGR
jgi:hypothetical protein